MHEILRQLPAGARVLDLGSGGSGSVGADQYPLLRFISLDYDLPRAQPGEGFVQGDAARLPFRDHSFAAVIANHSLEHFSSLADALAEIGRVIQPDGSLFVSVPDAASLTDRIYRWIFNGGGHVNAFRSAEDLERLIATATGLKCVGRRLLHSSLIFLDRNRLMGRAPRKLWLFANGPPWFVTGLTYGLRQLDRTLDTRSSVYGWAFYFGELREPIETTPWTNVCVHCGTGHSAAALVSNEAVVPLFGGVRRYRCSSCWCWNLFTEDRHNGSM